MIMPSDKPKSVGGAGNKTATERREENLSSLTGSLETVSELICELRYTLGTLDDAIVETDYAQKAKIASESAMAILNSKNNNGGNNGKTVLDNEILSLKERISELEIENSRLVQEATEAREKHALELKAVDKRFKDAVSAQQERRQFEKRGFFASFYYYWFPSDTDTGA